MKRPPFAVQAVLFDLDGTLVDSAPDLALAVERMRASRQLAALPLTRYRPHASAGARGMIQVAFGVSPDDLAYGELKQEFLLHYEQCLLHSTRCFDGVEELLTRLASGLMPWGIVTNKAQRLTEPMLAGLPALAGAGALVCGDTTPWAKPHPEPLLVAARRLGVSPDACIYVGDDERDIVAGREAGMFTVAANYGYLGESGETAHWGADAEVLSPLQVLNLLELP
ncbi:MAG: HAD-IA family hydrolase [Hydrogenophaga sp.]|jgi:phosphoglycolate phosphatase|nr:HAD-IA family hydrolase [Hydrogenophaga sp.]